MGEWGLTVFRGQTILQLLMFHEIANARFPPLNVPSRAEEQTEYLSYFVFLLLYEVILFFTASLLVIVPPVAHFLINVLHVLLLPLVSFQVSSLISHTVISTSVATPRSNCT